MFNSQLKNGLLFNHLSEWLLIASNSAVSESDLIVKLARLIRKEPNITHDHHVPRKIRAGSACVEEVNKFINGDAQLVDISKADDTKPTLAHGWYSFKCMIDGLKSSSLGKPEYLNSYWQFLEAHCELESNLLETANKENAIELCEQYLSEWLHIDNFNLSKPDKSAVTIYVVRLILYWAAIFELFLEIKFETKEHSILKEVLPTASRLDEQIEFSPTSEKLLEVIRAGWAKEKYNKSKISWKVLYRDILRSQMQDPTLTQPPINSNDLTLIAPDTSSIKKRFDRWRAAKTLFSLYDFRAYLTILRIPFTDSEDDLRVAPYLMINMFTHIQRKLIESKADAFLIVKTFAEYNEYKSLVQNRYDNFCSSGRLRP